LALKVIIADDDPVVRALMRSVLDGAESLELVGEATDADEAVALAEQHRPQVAVLDWMMPAGGGPAAARGIGERSPETSIVALTSSDSEEASVDMLRAGAKSFLVKGGSAQELISTIERAAAL
jgi:DNA-binding NarL/FixJ family response regulator